MREALTDRRCWLLPLLIAVPLIGCEEKKAPVTTSPEVAKPAERGAPAPLPADASTVATFRAGHPKSGAGAKVHGFVVSTNGNAWPLVDKVGDTLPFVFCKMATVPSGIEKGAHVLAEGKVEDDAMLRDCTVTPL